jgi:hypothetical protein
MFQDPNITGLRIKTSGILATADILNNELPPERRAL